MLHPDLKPAFLPGNIHWSCPELNIRSRYKYDVCILSSSMDRQWREENTSSSLQPLSPHLNLSVHLPSGLLMTAHEMSSGPRERGGQKQHEIRLDSDQPSRSRTCSISNIKGGTAVPFTYCGWYIVFMFYRLLFFFPNSLNTYIYAFSRRFYPKRLTVHSGYTFFYQYVFHALLTQCSTTEPQEHQHIDGLRW